MEKKKKIRKEDTKKYEMIFSVFVGIIFIILVILTICNLAYLPACLISLSLEIFCVCYYYIDDEERKTLVYSLFGVGVSLIIIAVVYTLIRII